MTPYQNRLRAFTTEPHVEVSIERRRGRGDWRLSARITALGDGPDIDIEAEDNTDLEAAAQELITLLGEAGVSVPQ